MQLTDWYGKTCRGQHFVAYIHGTTYIIFSLKLKCSCKKKKKAGSNHFLLYKGRYISLMCVSVSLFCFVLLILVSFWDIEEPVEACWPAWRNVAEKAKLIIKLKSTKHNGNISLERLFLKWNVDGAFTELVNLSTLHMVYECSAPSLFRGRYFAYLSFRNIQCSF